VSDTGQGMTPDQVSKLFDEYARFNMEANRSTEGTGLGMSITKNLIRLMNGEIIIESVPQEGSTFTARIPQEKGGDDILGRELAENLHKFRTRDRVKMNRIQITREPMPYGRVLVVDDVETNIYVAQGLMAQYELMIDSADSGFAAIEKIKNGNTYDIIFMDHMMPKMDGIETTKLIRNMGYERPIVALTANAVAGQSEIFLSSGFDDFLSKPIDLRQLNTVLNKLIRDKQTREIREAAMRRAAESDEADDAPTFAVDPIIAEIFVRDANKSLAVLEALDEKNDYGNEENIRSYIIHVHGMKSALANVGKNDLSADAAKLEAAGREGKIDLIADATAVFLKSIKAFVEELEPKRETAEGVDMNEDKPYLAEMLLKIKAACEEFDENTADEAITELRKAEWSQETTEMLRSIAEHLLHSDFDEIADDIGKFIATL